MRSKERGACSHIVYCACAGLVPPSLRGTTNNQLMHISDWYTTFTGESSLGPPRIPEVVIPVRAFVHCYFVHYGGEHG